MSLKLDDSKTNISWHLSRRQSDNLRTGQERYTEVSGRLPEIVSIDEEIKKVSLEAVRRRILSDEEPQDITDELKLLSDRKKALLISAGYPDDYLEPVYTCPYCHDEGYIDGTPCRCVKQLLIKDLYNNSNLDKTLSKENFDTFSLSYYSKEALGNRPSPYKNMSHILNKARDFTFSFTSGNEKNILMHGEPGLGKTFLTNCIAHEVLNKGHTVLYLTANELFNEILSVYLMDRARRDTAAAAYSFVYESELLIIDDLGTEIQNSFVTSQLFEIVNRRIINGLSTIISTNLTPEELRDRYSDRVLSRLVEHYDFYYFYGDNIRYQKRNNIYNQNR